MSTSLSPQDGINWTTTSCATCSACWPPQVKTYCLFRWTGMQVMHKYGKGWWCKFADDEFVIMAEQINSAIAALDWINQLPPKPVRISRIDKHRALTADFQEVPFETFIICDNLYQGYLSVKEDALLDEERIGVFYWFASLKEMFARQFKHFFKPISNAGDADGNMFEQTKSQYEILYEAINSQIRALTKGDVTKEKEVLAIDTWRALTELDALAKEYDDFNKKYPNK